ncbi:MAG: hypothetical protein WA775_02875 [Psychroserpens sp.]|uniref:hypothetical protein n=1 Tax=Psychroserpens sp. TaxID=2020870 RepID=UPI003C853196
MNTDTKQFANIDIQIKDGKINFEVSGSSKSIVEGLRHLFKSEENFENMALEAITLNKMTNMSDRMKKFHDAKPKMDLQESIDHSKTITEIIIKNIKAIIGDGFSFGIKTDDTRINSLRINHKGSLNSDQYADLDTLASNNGFKGIEVSRSGSGLKIKFINHNKELNG